MGLTHVKYGGRKTITNFGEQVEADEWTWKFLVSDYKVYTNPCADCVNNVTLLQWGAGVLNTTVTIQFKNYPVWRRLTLPTSSRPSPSRPSARATSSTATMRASRGCC